MSGKIPQQFIDEVISRADIAEVVGRRVQLKRTGAYLKGLCPFHNEKTPSFIVTPERGTYHCFGCGAHDTAVGFLMNYEKMSFVEAVESLAEMLGLALPETGGAGGEDFRLLYGLLDEAAQFFRAQLKTSEKAIGYLKSRDIDGQTAARFGMGYAPDSWDALLNRLGTSAPRREEMVRAGLLRRRDSGGEYDYFRDRLIFPIRDARGRTLGFGGRVLGEGEPKYLNSPETPVFEKRKTLYGIHEARGAGNSLREVLVVEGYMDVVGLARHGIGPAFATLGTATTPEHVQRLTRLAQRIVFCFDGDAAGRKAALRALETCLPVGGGTVELAFALLPEGEDPDSLVRSGGPQALTDLCAGAKPLSAFLVSELIDRNSIESADGRARALSQARPLIAQLPAGIYRELIIDELAAAIGMLPERLAAALFPGERAGRTDPGRASQQRPGARRSGLIRRCIGLLLRYPGIAREIETIEGFDAVDLNGADLLRAILAVARDHPEVTTAHLIERFRDDAEGRYLPVIAADEVIDDAEHAPEIIADSLRQLVAREERRRKAAAVKAIAADSDP